MSKKRKEVDEEEEGNGGKEKCGDTQGEQHGEFHEEI
jgi:hypothetical protein